MNGVYFGNIHSYNDLHLFLKRVEIGSPTAKTSSVDIEGGNGKIDTTNALTDIIFYNNRKLTFKFVKINDGSWHNSYLSSLLNSLHGKHLKIRLDADARYYYMGRLSVDGASDLKFDEVSITCDCEPYKYLTDLNKVVSVSGENFIDLIEYENTMPTALEINVDNECDFKFVKNDSVQVGNRNLFKGYKEDEIIRIPDYQGVGSFTRQTFVGNLTFNPSLTVGKTYTISFWAVSPNGETPLQLYNRNSNPRYFYIPTTWMDTALSTEWKFYTYTFTNSDMGEDYDASFIYVNRLEIYAPNKTGVLVKNIKVEEGELATPYCEAVENGNSVIDSMSMNGRNLFKFTKNMPISSTYNGADGISKYREVGGDLVATTDGVKLTFNSNTNSCISIPLVYDGCVANNETVTLSFDYRGNITNAGNFFFLQRTSPNISIPLGTLVESETEWQHFEATFSSEEANARVNYQALMFYSNQEYDNTKWIEIKKGSLKLESGNVATPYCESWEELVGASSTTYHLAEGTNIVPIAITEGTHAYQIIKTDESVNGIITMKRGDL